MLYTNILIFYRPLFKFGAIFSFLPFHELFANVKLRRFEIEDLMRPRINLEFKLAEKERNKERLSTLRLILTAIKDRDTSVRCEENARGVSDEQIIELLNQMIEQRNRSVVHYQESGRLEDAEREQNEIRIIQEFLPKQMTDEEMMKTIYRVIISEGAASIRDMGKVIRIIKRDYSDQLDSSRIVEAVKRCLIKNNFS